MIASLPSGRSGQGLALLLLAATMMIGWIGIIDPVLSFYTERNRKLDQQTMLADHLAAQAADLPRLRAAQAAKPQTGAAVQTAIEGATEAVAAANLQNLVEELAAAASVPIESIEPLQTSADAMPQGNVGISVRTTCSYGALAQLLNHMRQITPLLSIDAFELHAVDEGAKPGPGFAATFTIRAAWAAGGAK